MRDPIKVRVSIVDYGMGNLFSVKQACERAGLAAVITSSPLDVMQAEAVILPGVGAFADAIATLTRLDLVQPLLDFAESGKPLVGICLGMQLLMTESYEFGRHQGLGLIDGEVVLLQGSTDGGRNLKVPQVGWNRIYPSSQMVLLDDPGPDRCPWPGTLLQGLEGGTFMYFVHSYFPRPSDPAVVLTITRYGQNEFCSTLKCGNIFATQFHPERSGPQGLLIYRNLANLARTSNLGN